MYIGGKVDQNEIEINFLFLITMQQKITKN